MVRAVAGRDLKMLDVCEIQFATLRQQGSIDALLHFEDLHPVCREVECGFASDGEIWLVSEVECRLAADVGVLHKHSADELVNRLTPRVEDRELRKRNDPGAGCGLIALDRIKLRRKCRREVCERLAGADFDFNLLSVECDRPCVARVDSTRKRDRSRVARTAERDCSRGRSLCCEGVGNVGLWITCIVEHEDPLTVIFCDNRLADLHEFAAVIEDSITRTTDGLHHDREAHHRATHRCEAGRQRHSVSTDLRRGWRVIEDIRTVVDRRNHRTGGQRAEAGDGKCRSRSPGKGARERDLHGDCGGGLVVLRHVQHQTSGADAHEFAAGQLVSAGCIGHLHCNDVAQGEARRSERNRDVCAERAELEHFVERLGNPLAAIMDRDLSRLMQERADNIHIEPDARAETRNHSHLICRQVDAELRRSERNA